MGNFQNWQCYTGNTFVSGNANVINVNPSAATSGIHTIIPRGKLIDPYVPVTMSPPGTSAYSVKLGNNGTGAQSERISYVLTVPQNEFVISYQYAVVLEDAGHAAASQPRFTAKVFDITDNTYITCGSFDYVATANLPGFKKGPSDIVYKDWTPVTINLYGYVGHQIRMEFTTADCTLGGHFGYAYVDVGSDCSSLISGSNFCTTEKSAVLTGPGGFATYQWYNADRSKLLGSGSQLVITPLPAEGTKIILDIVPYAGFGCPLTTSAIMHPAPIITFNVTDPPPVCFPATINLTDSVLKPNSDSNLTYTYFTDPATTVQVANAKAVTTSGTYYIKATAPSGCVDIKTMKVVINPLPGINITDPQTVCISSSVDITAASIVNGNITGIDYTYWIDSVATKPLSIAEARAIKTAGTYYIKAINTSGCGIIKPVRVTYYQLPVLVVTDPADVCYPSTVDLTAAAVTKGTDADATFTYWYDASATKAIASPDKVPQTGTYYIKATSVHGCITIKPVKVTVNPLPILTITNPGDLCTPYRADLTAGSVTTGSSNYVKLTYWRDAAATITLLKPEAVTDSGTYYIKATSTHGCEVVRPVLVPIHKTPVIVTHNPVRVHLPNTVDLTLSAVTLKSTPNLTYTYFTDAGAIEAVTDARAIDRSGTYYIKGTTKYGCFDIKPVQVTVLTDPLILVPKAFTPTHSENNKLYPFLVSVKRLVSFKIYNHWGALIFQTDSADPAKGWDGLYNGKYQFLDTYTWYAEGLDYFGQQVHNSGNTLLLK